MKAKNALETILRQWVAAKGFEWPDKATIEPPREKGRGDLAANMAMVLAGQARMKPRDVASDIASHLESKAPWLESVEIAGPGFLNIVFKQDFWRETVTEILEQGERYGAVDLGRGKKIMVEYVSANPTGPLHIGHGRGAAIGDSLTRITRFMGYDTASEYYINDAGRQMRLLGLSVLARARQSRGMDVELPEECYKGEYIKDIAAELLERRGDDLLDMPDAEAVDICRQYATDAILSGIKSDLEDFGAEHQIWFSEQSLLDTGAVDKAFKLLKDNDMAHEADGAFWFKSTAFGDDKDRVLRKSDGSLTYFASDIAYHADKYRRGFDFCVDVWGADHHGYVPRMKAAVQAMGRDAADFDVVLVQLVALLRDGEPVAMSTRAGQFVPLAEVCREVGVDAARFIFLSRKSDSPLDFDLELVKQKTMENPVYYVQYAHARIMSVFRKAGEHGVATPDPSPDILARLDTPEDLVVLKLLEQFPDALVASARGLSPHHLSYYLMELAGGLHRYYTVNQVLVAGDEQLVAARLLLLRAVAQVVRNGLGLLGVSAPESM